MIAPLQFFDTVCTYECGEVLDPHGTPVDKGVTMRVCAWCDKDGTLTAKVIGAGYLTSHGICDKCLGVAKEQAETTKERT